MTVLVSRKPAIMKRRCLFYSHRCFLVSLSLFIVAVFLFCQVMLDPIPHFHGRFRQQEIDEDSLKETARVSAEHDIPALLSPVIAIQSGPVHSFTVPTVLTYYQDVLPNNCTKLYLVTSGIMMKASKRNLTAVACQVGPDIFPASLFITEVLHCEIPRRLRRGERLAAVLAWDDQLKRAAQGPVKLRTGIVAELHPGDITKLPNSAVLRGNLTSANRDNFRVARSDLHVGPSDEFVAKTAKYLPRYRLCLMTMVAPNSHMLKDWADYHRRIGVDQVYIFDNGAARDLKKMFEDRMDVEIIRWPFHKSQRQVVSAFVYAARSRCERVMLEDSDEYPMLGLGNGTAWRNGDPPLIRYAKKAGKHGFQNYKLLHLVMGNSGFLRRPKGEVPMNFIHRRRRQTFQNGKSVCYMDLEWQTGAIHGCGEMDGRTPPVYRVGIHRWGDVKMTPEEPDDPPFLMHFRDRSWEEYIEKWDAGRVSGKLVADEKAGTMRMDEPDEDYMRVRPEFEFTYFRDKIYARVLKEGTLHEQTIVQTTGDGRRCERLYHLDKKVRTRVRERCE